MITRIVKMIFRHEEIEPFKSLFHEVKSKINDFEGCQGVRLLEDISNPATLFTISIWQSPEHLEAYRNSELFSATWYKTKLKFAGKPEAWSLNDPEINRD
jgi:heme-degrading monooxygenase HmoA